MILGEVYPQGLAGGIRYIVLDNIVELINWFNMDEVTKVIPFMSVSLSDHHISWITT